MSLLRWFSSVKNKQYPIILMQVLGCFALMTLCFLVFLTICNYFLTESQHVWRSSVLILTCNSQINNWHFSRSHHLNMVSISNHVNKRIQLTLWARVSFKIRQYQLLLHVTELILRCMSSHLCVWHVLN